MAPGLTHPGLRPPGGPEDHQALPGGGPGQRGGAGGPPGPGGGGPPGDHQLLPLPPAHRGRR